MRPDLLSRRGPAGRSTTAWALRPAVAATAFGKLAPDLLMAGSQLTLGITAGLARDSAPSNPGSGCRGDAMLPFEPTRPAHGPALPALRRGVTAPPSTALTKGGESPPEYAPRRRARGACVTAPRGGSAHRQDRRAGRVNPSGGSGWFSCRTDRRSRFTTTVSTSISSRSMNAAKPSGPKASGNATAPAG